MNFGEAGDPKGFVIAELQPGSATYTFREIPGRRFFSRDIRIASEETFQDEVLAALPSEAFAQDAMVRLTIRYPADWEAAFDPREARRRMRGALEFHLIQRPERPMRQRISSDTPVSSLSPADLLRKYCETLGMADADIAALQRGAAEIFAGMDI